MRHLINKATKAQPLRRRRSAKQRCLGGPTVRTNTGFALLAALWIAATLAFLTIGIVSQFLTNTDATRNELVRLKQDMLHQAGIRIAALSLASQRHSVASSGVPFKKLKTDLRAGSVTVEIENEAARLDLRYVSPDVFAALLYELELGQEAMSLVLREYQHLIQQGRPLTYRLLREWFSVSPRAYQRVLRYVSLHNGEATVHPQLASSGVLALLPDFASADRLRLLAERKQLALELTPPSGTDTLVSRASLVSTPVTHPLLDARLSAFYRVTVTSTVGDQVRVRHEVIKMANTAGMIFESVAQL